MSDQRFIQKAIQHPGSLRKFAEEHNALNRDGTINLEKAKKAANRESDPGRTHRLRQIALAHTLKRLRA